MTETTRKVYGVGVTRRRPRRFSCRRFVPQGQQKLQRAVQNPEKGEVSLGYFKTPEEAHYAYVAQKVSVLVEAARKQSDRRVAHGLRSHAINLIKGTVKATMTITLSEDE